MKTVDAVAIRQAQEEIVQREFDESRAWCEVEKAIYHAIQVSDCGLNEARGEVEDCFQNACDSILREAK